MAYNMNIGLITPDKMEQIVWFYNNAPHSTLSKYAGEEVSPQQVDDDPVLEEFIARRIQQQNVNTMMKNGFKLNEGVEVNVYNEKMSMAKRRTVIQPGKHKILSFERGLYRVGDENGEVQMIPRYKLDLSCE